MNNLEDKKKIISHKAALFNAVKSKLSIKSMESYQDAFFINYTHHSTAIEGNTLSLIETKVILEDKLSIGGKELREIFEIYNHKKAFQYVEEKIKAEEKLSENITKDIHSILMENIMPGGIYRDGNVKIQGASFQPPEPQKMYYEIKSFYADFDWRVKSDPIEYAAWTHAEFVRIHPFFDGNGRTSRMILNYQLMKQEYLPIIVKKENRLEYYKALDNYAVSGDLKGFTEFIADLELYELDAYLDIAVSQGLISKKDI